MAIKSEVIVTVIVPCFNYGHFLRNTFESLSAQTERRWECIVIDDGSTDDTKSIVAALTAGDPRFRYIYQGNKGLSAARNAGMKEACGTYIQFLDADDLLERRKLEAHVAYLERHPDVDIVYGDARYFPSDDPEQRFLSIDGGDVSPIRKLSGGREDLLRHLVVDNIFVVSSPLLRREVIESCGYFDENLRGCEDWEYWLRCASAGMRFCYSESDEALTLIRFHRNSLSKNRSVMLTANLEVRRRLQTFLREPDLQALNEKGIANATIALAADAIRGGALPRGVGDLVKLCLQNGSIRPLLQGVKSLAVGK
jgi:glycosyltransferase involved in cell wall biosynthesis